MFVTNPCYLEINILSIIISLHDRKWYQNKSKGSKNSFKELLFILVIKINSNLRVSLEKASKNSYQNIISVFLVFTFSKLANRSHYISDG